MVTVTIFQEASSILVRLFIDGATVYGAMDSKDIRALYLN